MKYKTMFRVLLKVVAVWIGATAIGSHPDVCRKYRGIAHHGVAGWRNVGSHYWFIWVGAVAQLAIAAYLFFGGKWLADKAIPGNRPYCNECGYDLTGAQGSVCNECGTPFRAPADVTPVEAR